MAVVAVRAACRIRDAADTAASTEMSIQRVEESPRRPSILVDEKRTRFLEHLVEFFGGHFSD